MRNLVELLVGFAVLSLFRSWSNWSRLVIGGRKMRNDWANWQESFTKIWSVQKHATGRGYSKHLKVPLLQKRKITGGNRILSFKLFTLQQANSLEFPTESSEKLFKSSWKEQINGTLGHFFFSFAHQFKIYIARKAITRERSFLLIFFNKY